MEPTRWTAPDLSPKERADLEAIDGLDWSGTAGDEAFRRRWSEIADNPGWYEELKASWGRADRTSKAKGARRWASER